MTGRDESQQNARLRMLRWAIGHALCSVVLAACVTSVPRASAVPGLHAAPGDTALLAAVIRAQQERAGPHQPLGVDPRPLVLGLGLPPERTEITQGAVSEEPANLVRERALLLERLRVTRTDAVDDYRCQGTAGLLPPPPSDSAAEPAVVRGPGPCSAKGAFVSLVFGLPRPGGAYYPPANIDERAEGEAKGYWTVRMVHISPSGFGIYDMVLGRNVNGTGWQPVEEKMLYHIVS